MARKNSSTPPRIARTTAELAAALGTSPRTPQRWQHLGCPRLADGTWDIDAVARWHASYVSRAHDTSNGPGTSGHVPAGPDPLLEARVERLHFSNQRLELKLRVMRGELIPREEVLDDLLSRARTFKRGVRGLGRRLARKVARMSDPKAIEHLLAREHDEILAEAYGSRD